MDKLQAMIVFTRIAEMGSLTAAAESLGKSLPAVVRVLAALEQDLQTRLFNRTTRRIALTEEGRFYLMRCGKILAEIDETEQVLANEQAEPTGTITITAPVRFGGMHVAPAINRFLKNHPRMQVNLLLLDRVVNMLDEGIDVAVRIAPLNDSSLVAKQVGETRQVVVVSPQLLADVGQPSHPSELAELPCVRFTGISASSHWQFQDGNKKLSVKVDGPLMCNHIETSVESCIDGMGFGQFYCYQVMPYVKQDKLKIILQHYEPSALPVNLVYQHRQLLSSKIRIFIDKIASELQERMQSMDI